MNERSTARRDGRGPAARPAPAVAALGEGTAGRILAAALRLFADRGYHGTSIRDIGAAIGLQPANLYAYFESKEHVLAELVRRGHETHHRALRHALLAAGARPGDQIRAFVTAHVRVHAEHALLAIVATSEMRHLSTGQLAPSAALRRESELLLVEIIERGVAEGAFQVASTKLAANAIAGMGARVADWYPSSGIALEELIASYATFALQILGARRTETAS